MAIQPYTALYSSIQGNDFPDVVADVTEWSPLMPSISTRAQTNFGNNKQAQSHDAIEM
jgi:hypothetical protein